MAVQNVPGSGRSLPWGTINGLLAGITSGITIVAFLIDRPLLGLASGIVLLVAGYAWMITLLAHQRPYAAAFISCALALVTFFAGTLVPPYFRPVALGDMPIEALPLIATNYEGVRMGEGKQGTSQVLVQSVKKAAGLDTRYQLTYELPAAGDGKVGIVLKFVEPQNITSYRALVFDVLFSDSEARCNLYFKDSLDVVDPVMLGDGKIIAATATRQSVRIPFDEYTPNIAFSLLREVGCDASTSFVRGTHTVTFSNVRFER